MPAIEFIPYGQAALLRSYIRDFYVTYGPSTTIEKVGRVIHLHYSIPGYFQDTYITLKSEFDGWNSNCYTLDWIIEDEYTLVNGGTTHVESPYQLATGLALQSGCAYVNMIYVGGSILYVVELERAPAEYWFQLPTWDDLSPL